MILYIPDTYRSWWISFTTISNLPRCYEVLWHSYTCDKFRVLPKISLFVTKTQKLIFNSHFQLLEKNKDKRIFEIGDNTNRSYSMYNQIILWRMTIKNPSATYDMFKLKCLLTLGCFHLLFLIKKVIKENIY